MDGFSGFYLVLLKYQKFQVAIRTFAECNGKTYKRESAFFSLSDLRQTCR